MRKRPQGFTRSERLKQEGLFKRLFKEGRYFKTGDFSIRVLDNNLNISRLGLSVGKKTFPKATQRNRIKRLIREAFRRNKAHFTVGYDIVIKPQSLELINLGYDKIEKDVLNLLNKAGILKQE